MKPLHRKNTYAFITRMIQGYESYLRKLILITPTPMIPRKIFTSRLLFRIIICSIEKASSEWRVLTAWNSPTAENTEIETGRKTDSNAFQLDQAGSWSVFIFELVCSDIGGLVIVLEHFRSYFRSNIRPEVMKWGQVRLILGSGLSLCLGQNCSHCDIFIQFKNHVMYYTFTTRVPNRLVPCGIYHSIHYQQAWNSNCAICK